jgi:predicted lipid-binding transport protein (Tim44 family)
MKINKIIIIAIIALLFNQVVYAGRLGGGRSRGMQRSTTSYQYNKNYTNNQNRNYQANPVNNNQQNLSGSPQRGGINPGTAALMGAAAGAAGGYMLGKNSANNEANASMPNDQIESVNNQNNLSNPMANSMQYNNVAADKNQIPWGIISILLVILLIGVAFFRKKTDISNNQLANNADGKFNDNLNNNVNYNNQLNRNMLQQQNDFVKEPAKLIDGIEREFFLRQAKGMFLHIQSMNNKDNVNEIAKYLTPELYQNIKDEINNNEFIADFINLDCIFIDNKLEADGLIASVRFTGMVSESPNKNPESFSEIWHFLKKDIAVNKWIVAGIQQEDN